MSDEDESYDATVDTAGAGMRGTLDQVGVVALAQMLVRTGQTGRIEVVPTQGEAGVLEFEDGRVVSARVGPLAGVEAFGAVCAVTAGRFLVEYGRPPQVENISADTEGLLEAAAAGRMFSEQTVGQDAATALDVDALSSGRMPTVPDVEPPPMHHGDLVGLAELHGDDADEVGPTVEDRRATLRSAKGLAGQQSSIPLATDPSTQHLDLGLVQPTTDKTPAPDETAVSGPSWTERDESLATELTARPSVAEILSGGRSSPGAPAASAHSSPTPDDVVTDATQVTVPMPARPTPAPPVNLTGAEQTRCGYVVLGELAAGGTGMVYRARRPSDGAMVALKVLTRASKGEADAIQRFERETHAHARLDHPNVVRLVDSGEVDGEYFVATELVDGATLHDLIRRSGGLPVAGVVAVIVDVLSALSYLHAREMLHRDLKPKNVLIAATGEVKIVDFGFARDERDPDRSAVGSAVGTVEYMSPEQASGDPLDPRSDLFTCSTLIYEMLTGTNPYVRSTPPATLMAVHKAERPAFLEALPTLPPVLADVAERLGQRRKEDRIGSANAAIEELVELAHLLETKYGDVVPSMVANAGDVRRAYDERQAEEEAARGHHWFSGGPAVRGRAVLAFQRARRLGSIDPKVADSLKSAATDAGWPFGEPEGLDLVALRTRSRAPGAEPRVRYELFTRLEAEGRLIDAVSALAGYVRAAPEDERGAQTLAALLGDDELMPFGALPGLPRPAVAPLAEYTDDVDATEPQQHPPATHADTAPASAFAPEHTDVTLPGVTQPDVTQPAAAWRSAKQGSRRRLKIAAAVLAMLFAGGFVAGQLLLRALPVASADGTRDLPAAPAR